jgi:3-hydroxyacyl-[acyl-carrier-protein] dehydratase
MRNGIIERSIPHRPPFLFLDEVVELADAHILCRYTVRGDDPFFSRVFSGHYPDKPIVPGALLCEMMFQAAGVLLAQTFSPTGGTPLLSRLRDARFRHMIGPDTTLDIRAEMDERIANAYCMRGTITTGDRVAVRASFTCALADQEGAS